VRRWSAAYRRDRNSSSACRDWPLGLGAQYQRTPPLVGGSTLEAGVVLQLRVMLRRSAR